MKVGTTPKRALLEPTGLFRLSSSFHLGLRLGLGLGIREGTITTQPANGSPSPE